MADRIQEWMNREAATVNRLADEIEKGVTVEQAQEILEKEGHSKRNAEIFAAAAGMKVERRKIQASEDWLRSARTKAAES